MNDLKSCPNCGKKVEDFAIYCDYCGEILKKDKQKSTSTTTINPKTGEIVSETPETITFRASDSKQSRERPWYKPLKRKRPWYHPVEWFFWIGWSFYVVFRFLAVEIFRYFKWCVCWGRPDEL